MDNREKKPLDSQVEENQEHILPDQADLSKRKVLGIGAFASFLAACSQNQQPLEREEDVLAKGGGGTPDSGQQGVQTVSTSGTGDVAVGVDCSCGGGGPPPGAGAGGPPPGAGTGTPPPGAGAGTPPGATPPATGTPPPATGTPPPATNPVAVPAERYRSLIPRGTTGQILLNTSDMMGPPKVMSDGALVNVWGFTSSAQGFNQDRPVPSPVLELIEGMPVELVLATIHPHTIHLHGLDVDQANDGVPSTSGYVVGMNMGGVPIGGVAGLPSFPSPHSYFFTAPPAGTYMYHCHVDTVLHMEMGMSGTIVVRPPDGSLNQLWAGGPIFDREFIWQLHAFDSSWHNQTSSNQNTARYNPDYFMINGLEGADLLADPATVLHAVANETVLVRLVNIGYLPAVVDLGGIMFDVVSSDGRPLPQAITTTGFMVSPGERYDIVFTMPVTPPANATVNYLNIRGQTIQGGTAVTNIIAS